MQVWSLPSSFAAPPRPCAPGPLIDAIARPDFERRALRALNTGLPVAWWTVYQLFDDQPPRLRAQASFGVPDIALDCWRIYRAGVYRSDAHFAQAIEQASGAPGAVLTHCVASDFGAAHREQIYTAHGLSERLSLVSADPRAEARDPGALLAVNLYRHREQPRFGADEIDQVLALAETLLSVVRRHLELAPATPAQRLHAHCPQLTEREFDVCERLLRGWTFEGIGADLGVSASTVKTYRNRAFERLGIHHRNALFELALHATS